MKLKYFLQVPIAIGVVTFLTACSLGNVGNSVSSEPKFKISEEQMKAFILEGNNIEQCIYPKLKGLSFTEATHKVYNKMTPIELYVIGKLRAKKLKEIIGEKNYSLGSNDQLSENYFLQMFNRLNNQIANINSKECNQLKKEYQSELGQTKKEYENFQEQERIARKQAQQNQQRLEAEQRARAAYYNSPAGQAEIQRQQIIAHQQQILANQRAAQQAAEWQRLNQTISNGFQSVTNTMNQNTNMINSMTNSMSRYQYNPPQNSSTTCYRLATGIVRCNHR
ncbi:DUF5358 family protein [Rodentibacter ratti]|uniref:Lipoprotein n=1 Tax=Rodentibacter ratti TaxID=1906745 RepID=A0A1V3L8T7_9PAST|nr:DUF5358 family protein [Rodentibacter ratti]OOF86221.1 hypothetical protein BKG88_05120 [Rodentibacter ratti]